MTQIEELQGRILAAMERIGTGVEKLELARAQAQEEARAAADNSDLERALEEEKTANAQLEERVKVLHSRLQEAAAPAADSGEMEALKAELELLRNEVGNTDEKDALKLEVTRLKAALESAGNGLAAEKEALETELADLKLTNQQMMSQIEEAAGDLGDAVDQAALEAEITALKTQLAEAQAAAAVVPQDHEFQAQLDELRKANSDLHSTNEALRTAQAEEQAQVNAVLAKLEPLLANAQDLPEQNLPEGEEV